MKKSWIPNWDPEISIGIIPNFVWGQAKLLVFWCFFLSKCEKKSLAARLLGNLVFFYLGSAGKHIWDKQFLIGITP